MNRPSKFEWLIPCLNCRCIDRDIWRSNSNVKCGRPAERKSMQEGLAANLPEGVDAEIIWEAFFNEAFWERSLPEEAIAFAVNVHNATVLTLDLQIESVLTVFLNTGLIREKTQ